MYNDFERWEYFALAGFVVCLWHLRLSAWLELVAIGMLGIVLSACLHGLACYGPYGFVDPYKDDRALLVLQAGWAMRGASWFGIVAGLTAALIHIRWKMNAIQRAGVAPAFLGTEALRPWKEGEREASRDIRR